jgi:ERCC4-type nuclease
LTEIIVDTREQDVEHILNFFRQHNIPFCRKKLDIGDYSTSDLNIIIERKRIGELAGNLTGKDKLRITKEFERLLKSKSKMIVMVEGMEEDIANGKYRSKMSVKELQKRLQTWAHHYMFKIVFVKYEEAGEFILKTLR